MQNILPSKILLSLYNTLILPHINYCILSWGKENDAIPLLQNVPFVLLLQLDTDLTLSLYLNFTIY